MPSRNTKPHEKAAPLCLVLLCALTLQACSNSYTPKDEESTIPQHTFHEAPPSDARLDKFFPQIYEIEQLQTFYDEDEKPFQVLISSEMVDARSVIQIFILDNNYELISEIKPFTDGPCNWYEDFIRMDYTDENGDGKKNITIEATYMTGVGEMGAVPQKHQVTYIQTENGEFLCDEDSIAAEPPA